MSKFVEIKRLTVNHIKKMKEAGEKITCLTAYDYTSAAIVDQAGVDIILIGDSLGMVMNGYEDTVPVTLDEIIYHTKAVKKGAKRAFIVADMPFGSYHVSDEQGVESAIRMMKETGCDAVKLEGGKDKAPLVKKLTSSGINVMGHIGLMPQMVNTMGGFKIQGRAGHEELLEDAKALEEAGAFAVVLEGVVQDASKIISESISIPTIGIGAGVNTDGQVLVYHDVFGIFDDFVPKFVKRYCDVKSVIDEACKKYIEEVKESKFPEDKHSFS
jgi:3-methyl-2-oxobutanoate hydroxymethyltransferase